MNNPQVSPPKEATSSPSGRMPAAHAPDGNTHLLAPLKSIEGLAWKPGMQMRCVCCNHHTAWVCATCTTGPQALVPLCPQSTTVRKGKHKGEVRRNHVCLDKHRCNPTFQPRGKRSGAKRARPSPEQSSSSDRAADGESDSNMSD